VAAWSAHTPTDGTTSQRTARRSRVSLAAQRTGPTTDGTGWGWRGLALEPPGICARGRGRMDHGWGSRPGPGRMGRWCWAEKRADGAFFPFVGPNLMSVKKFSAQILGYLWAYVDYPLGPPLVLYSLLSSCLSTTPITTCSHYHSGPTYRLL
jgi:hypothetical protein